MQYQFVIIILVGASAGRKLYSLSLSSLCAGALTLLLYEPRDFCDGESGAANDFVIVDTKGNELDAIDDNGR